MTQEREKAVADGNASGSSQEEPVITGTLFLTTLLLIMIFGFWALMYLTLLGR